MKIVELSDAISMHRNKGQTLTLPVIRTGLMPDFNIEFTYFSENSEYLMMGCVVGNEETHYLLEKEGRLPFEENRDVLFDSMNFLFTETKQFIGDLNDEDNGIEYALGDEFNSRYFEKPVRDLLKLENLEMKVAIYKPIVFDPENEHVIIALEIGYSLAKSAGLVYYYKGRPIDSDFISTLE